MATSTIKGGVETFNLSITTSGITTDISKGVYDRNTGLVRIYFIFAGTVPPTFAIIPEKYRPSTLQNGCGTLRLTSDITLQSSFYFSANGNVYHDSTSGNVKAVEGTVEYLI